MIKLDPHNRIDLTGPWAGFGFRGRASTCEALPQGRRPYTP